MHTTHSPQKDTMATKICIFVPYLTLSSHYPHILSFLKIVHISITTNHQTMKFTLMPKLRLTRDPSPMLPIHTHFAASFSLFTLRSGPVDEALIAEYTFFHQKSTILFVAIFQHYRTPSTPDQKDSIHIEDDED